MIKKYHVSKNLWNEDYTDISSTVTYVPLYVGNGDFTLSTTFEAFNGITDIFLLSGNVSSGISSSDNGAYLGKDITKGSIGGYVTIAFRKYTRSITGTLPTCQSMLNKGSTALPYEPYGNTWNEVGYKRYENGEWVEYNDKKYDSSQWD